MKKIFTLAVIMTIAISAYAAKTSGSFNSTMSHKMAKKEALFLSDKMAHELSLTDAQYDAVYEINLDYMMSVRGKNDLYGTWWNRRNTDLQYVLTVYQYNKYVSTPYFYRPLGWDGRSYTFSVYSRYSDKSKHYKGRPSVYGSYKGGNNKKSASHYADRKPSQTGGSTWRMTGDNNGKGGSTWRMTGDNSSKGGAHDKGSAHDKSGTHGKSGAAGGKKHDTAQNAHGSFAARR